jgi:hypothetical protein
MVDSSPMKRGIKKRAGSLSRLFSSYTSPIVKLDLGFQVDAGFG